MSALARMLLHEGYEVAGTDASDSPVIGSLRELGANVRVGHEGDAVKPRDAVIVSDAIDLETSPEVLAARALECPVFRRSQVLGWLLRGKRTIAVTGTHGKTTTTAMIGSALSAAGSRPTIVVGADVPEFGGSVVFGDGEWAVAEACEAYDSLRDFEPEIVVLTNLEPDHLDFHGTADALEVSVLRFVERAKVLIYCESDPGASAIAAAFKGQKVPYNHSTFGSMSGKQFPMSLPGGHNALNAGAALSTAANIGMSVEAAARAIAEFKGAERRLQVLLDADITIIDDYAHHPTEVRATIEALREKYPGRRVVVVFQPHLYSRTAAHWRDFARELSLADEVVLTDIYPAREDPIPGVSSARIAEAVSCPVRYIPSRHLLARSVKPTLKSGDVVVGMGAGNIADFAPDLAAEWNRAGKTRVAVVFGGDSAEREVSIHSGIAVSRALRLKGYAVESVDVTEKLLTGKPLDLFSGTRRPDVAFLAVHGTHAEDGAVQGLMELLHIPYTGSPIQASALAMDKHLSKQILREAGIECPWGVAVSRGEFAASGVPADLEGSCWVVKPNEQGSTVGLSFVSRADELPDALTKAFSYGEVALIEEWLRGTEISVPVLDDIALPPVEIVPAEGVYDFAAKYTPGATEEICPARIPEPQLEEAKKLARQAHRALRCQGATRTDMLVVGDRLVVLEVNTLPGMTETSLLPTSAQTHGMDFADLCDWMVQDALRRHGAKKS